MTTEPALTHSSRVRAVAVARQRQRSTGTERDAVEAARARLHRVPAGAQGTATAARRRACPPTGRRLRRGRASTDSTASSTQRARSSRLWRGRYASAAPFAVAAAAGVAVLAVLLWFTPLPQLGSDNYSTLATAPASDVALLDIVFAEDTTAAEMQALSTTSTARSWPARANWAATACASPRVVRRARAWPSCSIRSGRGSARALRRTFARGAPP